MKHVLPWTTVCSALLYLTSASFADVAPLPSNRNIDIRMSNDNGALYGSGADDTYRIIANGGGLNQLHISTDSSPGTIFGQVTSTTSSSSFASGTFWVTTTGGRGYNDDIILLFSLQGPISNDFSVNIKSSGYQWTASNAGVVNPVYKDGAVDETFTKADFLYGPQTAKPGPGEGWVLPFYSGQNINDPATAQYLMFVDLYVGNDSDRASIDSGSAKVTFDIAGLQPGNIASFNAYAWAFTANIGNSSINWTNRLSTNPLEAGQSGYSVTAVPEPEQAVLLAVGLSAIFLVRRRRQARAS